MSFGVVGLLAVGLPVLAVGVLMTVTGARSPRLQNGAPMLITGAAAAPLLLAWLDRQGPGTVCHVQGTTTSCADQWSPWPFVGVALLLVVAGPVVTRRRGAH